MKITRFILGPLATNTYLLEEEGKVLLIDPASKAERLIKELGERTLCAVLLTHGHFDHIKAVDGLYDACHMPVYLHEADDALARDKRSGEDFGLVSYISCPTIPLEEGTMEIGPFRFEVIFTPGHTDGSVVYRFGDDLFTGDTLFHLSVGRTDLPGGNTSKLRSSLRYFASLDDDVVIHPGHEEESMIGYELRYNPFLR